MKGVFSYIDEWRKSATKHFDNLPQFELHLLTLGLVLRDSHLVVFAYDVDESDSQDPIYFRNSVLTLGHIDGITVALSKIISAMPVERDNAAAAPAVNDSLGSADPISLHQPPKKVTPRRKKPTATHAPPSSSSPDPSQPEVCKSTFSEVQDSESGDTPPNEALNTKEGEKKQVRILEPEAVRKSTREHKPSKKLEESQLAERGRGRGKGGRGRGRGRAK